MARIFVLFTVAAAHLRGSDWEKCGVIGRSSVDKRRIVHGEDAHECVWRWQVSLSSSTSGQFCGGTLISPNYVLTAAHCIAHVKGSCQVRSLRIHAGNWKRVPTAGATRHAKRIFMHPLYNRNVVHDYDFAIVELEKAMPMTECIGVACLPDRDETPGTVCNITGWGTLRTAGPTPEVLQEASVTLLNDSACEVNYTKARDVITGSMLCASGSSAKGIVDTCQGDSGGPLSCHKAGRYVLRGVTSWGMGCAYANFPGVYGRVQSVMAWIKDVTRAKIPRAYADNRKVEVNISGIDFNGSMWKVMRGNCSMDSAHCIMSPNYPRNYSVKDMCDIAVNGSAALPIRVDAFSTEEKFDALIHDCEYYSGTKGPEMLVPSGPIFWRSDGSVTSTGWKICPHRAL